MRPAQTTPIGRFLEVTQNPQAGEAHPRSGAPTFRRPRRTGRLGLPLAASLVANAALLGGLGYVAFAKPAATTNRTVETRPVALDSIQALGRLQPAGGVVNVFGTPGDRVGESLVTLGSVVAKGDRLLTLFGEAQQTLAVGALDAQLREATTALAAAGRARDAKRADIDAEVRQAKAKLDAELASLDARLAGVTLQEARAAGELRRLEKVQADGAPVADQDLVQVRTLAATAKGELTAIAIQKAKAVEQQAAGEAVAAAKRATLDAETDRALALIPVESLKASRAAAVQKVADAVVRAPAAGRVVKVGVRAGDTLGAVPVLQLADTATMTVVAEVYETDVARLRGWLAGGKVVEVEVDARVVEAGAAVKPLKGSVKLAGVAPMIAKNTVFALGPREDADRRVVEVEVTLDAESSRLTADFIGLQVRATFVAPK
jgi:HlyD family secretion protein